jgi:NADH-quinone oxidoreductase subunit A
MTTDLVGGLLYFGGVVVVVGGMMVLSHFLGERHRDPATHQVYESGIPATGTARTRVMAPFYLIAVFFVVFDLEVAFLFAWAVAFRELGWRGYVGALFFIGVLVVALFYEWRQGSLDWGPKPFTRRRLRDGRGVPTLER